MVMRCLSRCGFLLSALLLSISWGVQAAPSESYLDAFGKYSAVADRLAELVGAEEPLAATDIAQIAAGIK